MGRVLGGGGGYFFHHLSDVTGHVMFSYRILERECAGACVVCSQQSFFVEFFYLNAKDFDIIKVPWGSLIESASSLTESTSSLSEEMKRQRVGSMLQRMLVWCKGPDIQDGGTH